MADFTVLFYLYRNQNIKGILLDKRYHYQTILAEGYKNKKFLTPFSHFGSTPPPILAHENSHCDLSHTCTGLDPVFTVPRAPEILPSSPTPPVSGPAPAALMVIAFSTMKVGSLL